MNKRLYWLVVIAMCVSAFGATPQGAFAQEEMPQLMEPTQNEKAEYVPGQMIVVYRRGLGMEAQAETANSIAGALNGTVLEIREDAVLLQVDESMDIPSFTSAFAENLQSVLPDSKSGAGNIAYAQPNYIFDVPEPDPGTPGTYTPPVKRPNNEDDEGDQDELKKLRSTTILPTYPEDPYLYNTWGWWRGDTDVVWQDRSASPLICLIDTGVDAAHPDLAGMIINGKDVVNDDPIPDDDNGHGTHVAGVIAAKSNNKQGIAGVSNSKILAIKALDSRGRGDSWNIAYAIMLCANNSAVKIINMSFGSYGIDSYLYNALEYAIYTKGKLAIAAAGNGSTFQFVFPAAWAGAFVCADGVAFANATTACNYPNNTSGHPYNRVAGGLISVGAARSYWSSSFDGYHGGTEDGYLWVDTNGNGVEDGYSEKYYMPYCATHFSNFGAWVSIAAPGEDVTSTVPVSYPYYQQYKLDADPDGDGYDTWSGTSMAAPHVTGSAARIWSIGSKLFGTAPTNVLVKNQVISSGYLVDTALDFYSYPLQYGYYSTYYYASYRGEAPYCWPNSNTVVNSTESGWRYIYNSSNMRILNVADGMQRTSMYVYVYNALNGLPLKGAIVGAYQGTTAKSLALLNSNYSPVAILPNLPRNTTYDIKVNRPGFTNGAVVVSTLYIPEYYSYVSSPSLSVSIPPMGKITGVIDWIVYDSNKSDLDFYVWMPEVSNPYGGSVVGGYQVSNPPIDSFIGAGRLLDFPFARWNLDGGTYYDWAGTESITIKPRPGYATTPYYNRTNGDFYDFIVHDYEPGALDANDIYFRLWVGGKINATVYKSPNICDEDGADNIAGNADDENWWEPGYMWKNQFIVWDDCRKAGTYGSGGMWPYYVIDGAETSGRPTR